MKFTAAILSGLCATILLAILGGFTYHGIQPPIPLIAWAGGALVGIAAYRATPHVPTYKVLSNWESVLIFLFAVASVRFFPFILSKDGDTIVAAFNYCYPDLYLHIDYISFLASTHQWWPNNPILANTPLHYYFGADLLSSLLLNSGASLPLSLSVVSFLGAGLTLITLRRWGGAFAIATFLFIGGFAAWINFAQGHYLAIHDDMCIWRSMFFFMLSAQRPTLLGFPIVLLILTHWREIITSGRRILPLPIVILLMGSMPFIQLFFAFFLIVMLVGMIILQPASRKVLLKELAACIPFVLLTTWVVTSYGSAVGQNMGITPEHTTLREKLAILASNHLLPGSGHGWSGVTTLKFWAANYGIYPLALGFLLVQTLREKKYPTSFIVVPIALLLSCFVIRYAPWVGENMKIMSLCFLALAPFLAEEISKQKLPIQYLVAILLFGSGVINLGMCLTAPAHERVAKASDVQRAEELLATIGPDDIVACCPQPKNPVMLLGHPVLHGWEQHISTHGDNYRIQKRSQEIIMNGLPHWEEVAKANNVKAIFWSKLEKEKYPQSKLPWAEDTRPSLHLVE